MCDAYFRGTDGNSFLMIKIVKVKLPEYSENEGHEFFSTKRPWWSSTVNKTIYVCYEQKLFSASTNSSEKEHKTEIGAENSELNDRPSVQVLQSRGAGSR